MSNESSLWCPHCGQGYEVTPEYVEQYAGQSVACQSCGAGFPVPGVTGEQLGLQPEATSPPGPACPGDEDYPQSPPGSPCGIWRYDERPGVAVVTYTATFPDRCAKCNGPARPRAVRLRLWWAPFVLGSSILGILFVRFMNRKYIDVKPRFCVGHCRLLSAANAGAPASMVAGYLMLFLGLLLLVLNKPSGVPPFFAGLALAAVGHVWWRFGTRPLAVLAIDGRKAWVKGFDYRYWEALPSFAVASGAAREAQQTQLQDSMEQVSAGEAR